MKTSNSESPEKITHKDLMNVFWRSFPFEISWNYARQMHMGFAYSMAPIIKKLYKKKEDRAKALQRHMEFFNITPYFSTLVMGIVIAMEERNASESDFDTSSINNIKASLMGPLSGIGDSIFLGTWRVISAGIGISLAKNGNCLGAILFLLIYNIPTIIVRYFGLFEGYKLGTSFLNKIAESGLMEKVTKMTGIIGLMTIGSMIGTMVIVKTPLKFGVGNSATSVQQTLDSIMPCLLPVIVTSLIYWLLGKKLKTTTILIIIIIFSIIAAFFGLLK